MCLYRIEWCISIVYPVSYDASTSYQPRISSLVYIILIHQPRLSSYVTKYITYSGNFMKKIMVAEPTVLPGFFPCPKKIPRPIEKYDCHKNMRRCAPRVAHGQLDSAPSPPAHCESDYSRIMAIAHDQSRAPRCIAAPRISSSSISFGGEVSMKRARASLIHMILPHSRGTLTTDSWENMALSLTGPVRIKMASAGACKFRCTSGTSEWFSHTLSLWGVSHVYFLVSVR